jgi:hypothetical protein
MLGGRMPLSPARQAVVQTKDLLGSFCRITLSRFVYQREVPLFVAVAKDPPSTADLLEAMLCLLLKLITPDWFPTLQPL